MHDADLGTRFLCRLISHLQATLRRRATASATLWAAAAGLAAMAGLLAADAAVGLPAGRGGIYLAAAGATLAAALAAAGWTYRRRPSAYFVARLIEGQRPDLKNAVITFVELQSTPADDPSMAEAVARRAARLLSREAPEAFLPPSAARRPAFAAAAAATVLAVGLWMAQGTLFPPWTAATYAATAGDGPSAEAETAGDGDAAASCGSNSTASGGVPSLRALAAAARADADKFARLAQALGGEGGSAPDASGGGPSGKGAAGAGKSGGGAGGADSSNDAENPANNAGGQSTGRGGESSSGGGSSEKSGTATGGGNESAAGGGPQKAGDWPANTPSSKPSPGSESGGHEGSRKENAANNAPSSPATARAEGSGGGSAEAGGQGVGGSAAGAGDAQGSGAAGDGRRAPPSGGDPPLGKFTPTEEFPAEALDSLRRSRRLIDQADRVLRDGEVNDAFLGRMGMGAAEFRRFVTAWQRDLAAASAGPDATAAAGRVTQSPNVAAVKPGEILRPDAGRDARSVAGPLDLAPDGRQGWLQSGESRPSARLQPAVTAYFQAVGAMGPRKK